MQVFQVLLCTTGDILRLATMSILKNTIVALGLFALLCALILWAFRLQVEVVWEDLVLAHTPSASQAYIYGNRHFDASHAALYDIERAGYLFRKALELDPEYSNARHQLARIAFLKGDFSTALWYINKEIGSKSSVTPSSHYVRGLILGFMERYDEAAESFEAYLEQAPNNWAAVNDYAWVLLKDGRSAEALAVLENLLNKNQENAWLLNSAAIAAYELNDLEKAQEYIERASVLAGDVTREAWLAAYPGNDPRVAGEGIEALKEAIVSTMHTIFQETGDATLQ